MNDIRLSTETTIIGLWLAGFNTLEIAEAVKPHVPAIRESTIYHVINDRLDLRARKRAS